MKPLSGSPDLLVDPTDERNIEQLELTKRSGEFDGPVALLDISKTGGSHILDQIQGQLAALGGVEVKRFKKPTFSKPAPESLVREIAKVARHVIVALAD